MSKVLCHFRIDSKKLDKLKIIAEQNGKNYSKILRQKIDEIVELNKTDIKIEVIKLIKQLREPFIYVRIEPKKKKAKQIRKTKEHIANRLEEIFNLNNRVKQ